jgi:hypothetical protein
MAQYIADRRDVDFVLHEQLGVEKFSQHERFAEFNKKTVDLIIGEARNLGAQGNFAHPGDRRQRRRPV